MVKLQYWDGESWVDCGKFANERFAWISLGGDNVNYRTVDSKGKVLRDNRPLESR